MSMQATVSAAERSVRSVFVGNIPYEATEEQLKDIFAEVGPVISFRLVYDRENGKPKGYGFCEYKDQDTAMSAMRNLNGYELNGRALRVDNAANEKNKEELRSLQASLAGPPVESPYGPECDPDKAPEAISKAVASLPPEQMFELMKQMKSCIQNNPNEARNMLLVNPQLAYALLQAQVVMRIVEPQVAMGMLLRPNNDVQPLRPQPNSGGSGPPASNQQMGNNSFADPQFGGGSGGGPMGPDPRSVFQGSGEGPSGSMVGRDFDMRGDSRGGGGGGGGFDSRPGIGDRDVRMGPGGTGHPGMGVRDPREMSRDPREPPRDPRNMPHDGDMRQNFDPRARSGGDPRTSRGSMEFDQRGMSGPPFEHRGPPGGFAERGGGFDQRSPVYEQRDPRSHAPPQGPASGRPPLVPQAGPPVGRQGPPNILQPGPGPSLPSGIGSAPGLMGSQDQEKAALIMQVLQLSEQQIAMLPPEQRQSIMVLKEQIARNAQN